MPGKKDAAYYRDYRARKKQTKAITPVKPRGQETAEEEFPDIPFDEPATENRFAEDGSAWATLPDFRSNVGGPVPKPSHKR